MTPRSLSLEPRLPATHPLRALQRTADAVRATAAEMNFMKIPWVTDLFEGLRLAKDERRPVFLYMITGDPLDDC